MGKWEYLIWRAILAGMHVDDSGYSVEFRKPGPHGDDIAVFSKVAFHDGKPGEEAAGMWLLANDVTLPGWNLPWPA